MIIYQDTSTLPRRGPPPWLIDANGGWCRNLCTAEDRDGVLWGVGDSYMLGYQSGQIWEKLPDHWRCCVIDKVRPTELVRNQKWIDIRMVQDLSGMLWAAPIILLPGNVRAFRVRYGGPHMLPQLTPDQTHAEIVAKEARIALETGAAAEKAAAAEGRELREDEGMPMGPACRWAAEMLSMTHHLASSVIAALGLLDDQLIVRTLMACCGYKELPYAHRL